MKNHSGTTIFSDIIAILDKSVGGSDEDIGAHGAFWRDVSRDEFIALEVFDLPLIDLEDPSGSNLLKALKGNDPFDGSRYPQMPVYLDPVSNKDISRIERWIKNGCP